MKNTELQTQTMSISEITIVSETFYKSGMFADIKSA